MSFFLFSAHTDTFFRTSDVAEAGDIVNSLAEYLAENFPSQRAGPRTLNKIYQDLVQIVRMEKNKPYPSLILIKFV